MLLFWICCVQLHGSVSGILPLASHSGASYILSEQIKTPTPMLLPAIITELEKKPVAQLLVRLIVGCVFLSEGIQKFLFAESLGVGRFVKIGIPAPEIMAPFVGVVEIVCGVMVLAGLFTRFASIPLIINMLVAISTTKIPILLEKGFWAMAHEARTDWSMLLGSIVLLLVGSGGWSLDAFLRERAKSPQVRPKA
jgi:putative oxidoreductase